MTVFGASGRVGRIVVELLLGRGYQVVAFVHRANRLGEQAGLQVVQGDIHDRAAVKRAVTGSATVVSTLGSWGTPTKDIVRTGTANLIAAMPPGSRVISLTGHEAWATGDQRTLFFWLSHGVAAILPVLRKVLKDGEQHIALLQASQLDWTVVRSPLMTRWGRPDRFELSTRRPLPWATIHRQSVAQAIVTLVEPGTQGRQAPFIRRR